MGRRIERNDQDGATLILALVFIVVLGLVIGVLTSLAGTNLTDTVQLQGQRGIEYAVGGVTDAEIQSLRYLNGAPAGNNSTGSYQQCSTFPSKISTYTTSSGLNVTEDRTQYTVTVPCAAFPASRTVPGVTITPGANTLTAAANQFSAADVGQLIQAVGVPAGTTISAVASATSATMSANATSSACPTGQTSCTQSVILSTPPGQRLVLLRGCLGLNSGMNCAGGSPVVKAIVRFFDLTSGGSNKTGAGVTIQNWVVQGANH